VASHPSSGISGRELPTSWPGFRSSPR